MHTTLIPGDQPSKITFCVDCGFQITVKNGQGLAQACPFCDAQSMSGSQGARLEYRGAHISRTDSRLFRNGPRDQEGTYFTAGSYAEAVAWMRERHPERIIFVELWKRDFRPVYSDAKCH